MIARDVHTRMQGEVIWMYHNATVDAVNAVYGKEIDRGAVA